MDARTEEDCGRTGSDIRTEEPPPPTRPLPEPAKPTKNWPGSHLPLTRDEAPTSENPPVSGGVRKTSYESENRLSSLTENGEGEKIAATQNEGRWPRMSS